MRSAALAPRAGLVAARLAELHRHPADTLTEQPPLHGVCSNYYNSTLATLERVAARGYRRPGLCVERGRDERVDRRFTAACGIFQEIAPRSAPVPPLCVERAPREEFIAWFRRHQPDVVLGYAAEILDWMAAAGAHVPATHRFVCLNQLPGDRPCAGLDPQPAVLGARAIDLLIAQLHRNERGLPANPRSTTIPARWIEGPTLCGA